MNDERRSPPKGKAITSIDEVPVSSSPVGSRQDVEDLKQALGNPEHHLKELERALNPNSYDTNDYLVFVFRKSWYRRFWKRLHDFILAFGKLAAALKAIIALVVVVGTWLGIRACSEKTAPGTINKIAVAPSLRPSRKSLVQSVPKTVRTQERKLEINAPNGIAIAGGTVINPTVNNYAPSPKPRRVLSVQDQADLVINLSHLKGTLSVQAPFGDAEAVFYAGMWRDVFRRAGWIVDESAEVYISPTGKLRPGAIIRVHGQPPVEKKVIVKNTDPIYFISNALESQHVAHVILYEPAQPQGLITLLFGPSP